MHEHHVVYRQEVRRAWRRAGAWQEVRHALEDPRNLVPVAGGCHAAHHDRSRPLRLRVLPDGVFEFAGLLLGGPAAFEYLRRRYAGGDPRLDALLETAG